jgi:hypothetical protein
MKRLVMVAALVTTNAMALDFDTEWAKFADDFARLRPSKIVKNSPSDKTEVHALPQLDSDLIQVDPKSSERLGLKLTDPAMRDKVTKLYQKPETVVYSTTIR